MHRSLWENEEERALGRGSGMWQGKEVGSISFEHHYWDMGYYCHWLMSKKRPGCPHLCVPSQVLSLSELVLSPLASSLLSDTLSSSPPNLPPVP